MNPHAQVTHHARLVVVLARRQRGQPRALPGGMIERRRDLPPHQFGRDVHVILLRRNSTRLLKCVQGAQSVPRPRGGGPVLRNCQDHRVNAPVAVSLADALAESLHPVGSLTVIGGAHDSHVEEGG